MFELKIKHNDDRILILIAVLFLVLSASIIFWSAATRSNRNASQALSLKIVGNASLTIDFGNGRSQTFGGNIIESETLIDVLNQASKAGGFSYKLDQKNNLTAIEEFVNGSKKSWHWYLNGKKIDKSFNEIIVKNGDNVLIKYEQGVYSH